MPLVFASSTVYGLQDWEAPYMDALAAVATSLPGPVLEAMAFRGLALSFSVLSRIRLATGWASLLRPLQLVVHGCGPGTSQAQNAIVPAR